MVSAIDPAVAMGMVDSPKLEPIAEEVRTKRHRAGENTMIWDSIVWKEELQRELDNFRKFLDEFEQLDEYYDLRVEKFFFVSSFIIRKLSESYKLSDELESQEIGCVRHKRVENDNVYIDLMNYHHFERYYDLDEMEEC